MYKNWGYYFMIERKVIMNTTDIFPNQNLTKYTYLLNLRYLTYLDLLKIKRTNLTNPIFI